KPQSSHILARSLLSYATAYNVSLSTVDQLKELTGKGILATVDGRAIKVGKLKFVSPENLDQMLAATAIYVSVDGQYYGAITFTDHISPEAKQTMNRLKRLGDADLLSFAGCQAVI